MGNLGKYNFNAGDVPAATYDPIPAGWYTAIIEESDMTATKDGSGEYLKLKLQIVEGPHAGRVIYTNLNLQNRNEKAVEIAYRDLAAICMSVGVPAPKDSSELHNRKMQIKVAIKAADGQYEAGNEVKGYKPAEQAAPAPAGVAKPSWKR